MTQTDLSAALPAQSPPATEAHARPTFDALPLSPELREGLREMGYEHPTPVQLAVWEPVTRGRDAVVQARTGTGKTASFGMPIVDQIVKRSVSEVQALVLCPTRELALQVSGEVSRLAAKKDTKVLPIYGGAGMERQVRGIEEGAQVVVGTPGRVLDHIRRGTLSTRSIRLLVLDEADEMLSMGFERELTAILEALPATRQTLLFSATLPPDIDRMARNRLKNPEFLTLSGDHIGALEILHFVYMVASDKVATLQRIIEVENPESAVVFCNTRDETEVVATALQNRGYDADWLNGDLPQNDRERVMQKTREGRLRFLVATDVAARGIDISHLTHVINYDFPQDAEAYVHRTGRTGRAGRTGTAISLITPRDIGGLYLLRLTYRIRPVERQIPTSGELKTRAEADLVAMLAEAYAPNGRSAEDRALARRLLSHDHAEEIVAGLLREHLAARPNAQEDASHARRSEPKVPAQPVAEPEAQVPSAEAAERPAPREERRDRDRPPRERREGRREPRDGGRPDRPRDGARPDRPREPVARDARRPRRRDEAFAPVRADEVADRWNSEARVDGEDRAGDAERPVYVAQPGDVMPAAEFTNWQPPAEENDDEPLLGHKSSPPVVEAPAAPTTADDPSAASVDTAELFLSVGRRDGVRAKDILAAFVDVAGLDPASVQRVRVRERNTFASVQRSDVDAALAKLEGTQLGGRALHIELARERSA
ncbi:MAG: DEAD/DEAH box helicase [Polyangiaceae bacterium]